VSAAEYDAFKTSKSEQLREEYFVRSLPEGTEPSADLRAKWVAERPIGWIEHRLAFQPQGKYGSWIGKHNAIVKVNDTLFLHGGIGPKYAEATWHELNERVRDELKNLEKVEGGAAADPEGPLWYRGLAVDPEEGLLAHVDAVLAKHEAKRIVVAHTVEKSGIKPRFGGKVVMIAWDCPCLAAEALIMKAGVA
jgi:hypothetical protein